MDYRDCLSALARAAGRELTDDEVRDIYERIHRAALDIKAGRASPDEVRIGGQIGKEAAGAEPLFQQAAARAAAELEHEAAQAERQANLQVLKIHARTLDVDANRQAGLAPLAAVEKTIVRDYSGRTNVESLEQRVTGHKAYFGAKLMGTWEALGKDFLGFFQDRGKLLNLIRELRGEDSHDPLARAGAKAFHDTAEEARQAFNAAGGDVGRLDDWGMPQHHSQEKVAGAGREAWIDAVAPMLDRARYVDDLGQAWPDAKLRDFLGHAWDSIATNGHANVEAGEYAGAGKRANRHAEHRQIHFKDAESVIDYWNRFGERTAVEILHGHIDTMARDIAFIEHFGPNPSLTYQTLRDLALKTATLAEPTKTKTLEGRAVGLDQLYDYASGNTLPTYRQWLRKTADGIAHINTAAKLGGAALASLFGDKPMMEAVSHLNDLPMFQRWQTEMALLNPANSGDRALLQRQGLMLDSVRSGLQRFYEGLGESSTTGRIANAVMRITGMQAINDVRKGAFGLSLMSAIGEQIRAGLDFAGLADSDIRTLRNYGITEGDWKVWKLAKPQDMGSGNKNTLTPEAISRISDEALRKAGFEDAQSARRGAIVKLLGAVNTESEFAIVTPGWRERAQFYADLQRGTVKGEIARSVLQFKSFPWAMFQRGMDAVANSDGPVSKAVMSSYLITATTLAGAMLLQTRETLSGKDPRAMADSNWYKFWATSFLQGGALGIYGDFLYGINQTRYGSGPIEMAAGPTLGPLLEMGLVQPLTAIKDRVQGKDTHLAAQSVQDAKGFVPGGNIWYLKAAMDHLVWQRAMEALSPGYLATVRSRTMKEYGQDWWWRPGEVSPERAPEIGRALAR
jgi:hypothetical protein